jgi:hypothetical protein
LTSWNPHITVTIAGTKVRPTQQRPNGSVPSIRGTAFPSSASEFTIDRLAVLWVLLKLQAISRRSTRRAKQRELATATAITAR